MEISIDEITKLFTFHRDGYYGRWNFGMDPQTNWPISVDVMIEGDWKGLDKAKIKLVEHVGPETRRTVELPLIVLFDMWPMIQRLLDHMASKEAIPLKVPRIQ
jgi:hypothetical protein